MITTKEMKQLEKHAVKCGITTFQLMENAGTSAYNYLKDNYDTRHQKVLIFCYHGNNGGDGFVLGRLLSSSTVLFLGDEKKLKDEARAAYEKMPKDRIVTNLTAVTMEDYDLVVDALLGIGATGGLRDPLKTAVSVINGSDATVVSLDIPTGVDPDTGAKTDNHVEPDLILTFHDAKQGLEEYMHRTVILDIGIPKENPQ